MRRRILLLALTVLGLDQITKALAIHKLSGIPTVPILPGIFHLTFVYNTGVAFGLMKGTSLVVLTGTAVIIGWLVWSSFQKGQAPFEKGSAPTSRRFRICLGLLLGGAVGNWIDRFRLGGVIDFLDFRVWPVFNVADACITVGAILMAWELLKRRTP